MSDESGVTYTVKELIAMLERTLTDQIDGINRKLDRISLRLDERATNLRVDAIERRLAATEDRVSKLEIFVAGAVAVSKNKGAFAALAVAALGSIASLLWLALGGH